jgi:hypothetical protein
MVTDIDPSIMRLQDGPLSPESMFKNTKTIGPFNLGPKQTRLMEGWSISRKTSLAYAVNATARNGVWFQSLRYKYVNNEWTTASMVERCDMVLFEEIAEKYPRDDEGNPIWTP